MGKKYVTCPNCKGTGFDRKKIYVMGGHPITVETKCPICDGKGVVPKEKAPSKSWMMPPPPPHIYEDY